MSTYNVTITWKRNGERFIDNKYSRAHSWLFDSDIKIPASSSPQVVPLPYSDASAVDPEEAYLAALSSCHMLWFLSIAAKRNFVINEYNDTAEAIMGKNSEGKLAITKVTLLPLVKFLENAAPTDEENTVMHHEAHKKCFIANSVQTKIEIKPVIEI